MAQPDDALTRALTGLVSRGVLTAEQAGQVAAARDAEAAQAEPQERDVSTRPGAASRLPEVLGYLGGTFVVAAALLVVGWSWESFDHVTRVAITALSALVVYGAGLAIALGAAGGRKTLPTPDQDVRRRLVGVLLVVGAYLAAGSVALLFEDSEDVQMLPVGLTALVLTAVAVRLSPGVVPTLGLFAATVMVAGSPLNLTGELPALAWVLIFLALGLIWVGLGPRVTATPTAALAVGLGDLVITGWVASAHTVYRADGPDGSQGSTPVEWGESVVAPLGYAVLAVITILGVALYLRGSAWPWLVAATVSAAVLVFQVAGDAFGPAVAALVLGALLLAASALLILRRGRAEARATTGSAP